MDKIFLSITLLVVALVAALLLQAFRTGSSLVFTPSELAAKSAGEESFPRVRIAGRVVDGSISYSAQPEFLLVFEVEDPPGLETPPPQGFEGSKVKVVYRNVRPDMFAPGRDVIVDGDFESGALQASQLLTQCPSKYEPPTAPYGEGTSEYQPDVENG